MCIIESIANAIATQEGFFAKDSLAARLCNPGNLRAAPWAFNPQTEHGYWNATALPNGIAGLYHQIALDIARGWTLRHLISSWAPPSDHNQTDHYVTETVRRTGLAPDVPLWNYLSLQQIP